MAMAGWSTSDMLYRYTDWMRQEDSEALEAFRKIKPFVGDTAIRN